MTYLVDDTLLNIKNIISFLYTHFNHARIFCTDIFCDHLYPLTCFPLICLFIVLLKGSAIHHENKISNVTHLCKNIRFALLWRGHISQYYIKDKIASQCIYWYNDILICLEMLSNITYLSYSYCICWQLK